MKEKDILTLCLDEIKKIISERKMLNEDRKTALQFYRGDPEIVSYIKNRSKATTTDVADAIEWVKPSLLEIFASDEDATSLRPVSAEDVEAVENQNILVNHQLKVKNKWFMVLYDWFDDALKLKMGVVKYQWHRDVKFIDRDYEGLTQMEYDAKKAEKNLTVLSEVVHMPEPPALGLLPMSPNVGPTYDISVRYTIEDEYPLIEAIPCDDFGFPIRTRSLERDTFCYHRYTLTRKKFEKKYGAKAMRNVKLAEDILGDREVDKERYADLSNLGGTNYIRDNDDKDLLYLYECYFWDEDTDTPRIATICADTLCGKVQDNKYGKPPFEVITPIKLAHRIDGLSFYDLLKDIQRIRTSLLRQILDNVQFANNRRYFLNTEMVNLDHYLNNNYPGAVIQMSGNPDLIIRPEEKGQIAPEVFSFWEMFNIEKDYHSGVPRSFQGVNPKAMNETWRGMSKQISQAAQRVAMIARLFAEMGINPLVTDVVDMDIQFMRKSTYVRYMNNWKEITPDNIIGRYDVISNVGIGTGDKDQIILYTQQLLGLFAQCFKAGIGVVTADNVFHTLKELIKAMGFKNTSDFVTDPHVLDGVKMLIMRLMQNPALQTDPQIQQIIMALAPMIGLMPAQQNVPGGTYPNQETPEVPKQPQQPLQTSTTTPGGGYFG